VRPSREKSSIRGVALTASQQQVVVNETMSVCGDGGSPIGIKNQKKIRIHITNNNYQFNCKNGAAEWTKSVQETKSL